jgi:phosphoribosylanthranilate isomerase
MIVKICGLTNPDDARVAIDAGADLLGFVFAPGSRRWAGWEACSWIRGICGARKVGVFRDQSVGEIAAIRREAGLDLVQLHGSEPPSACADLGGRERVIRAVAVARALDWAAVASIERVARVLFDTATARGGGSGEMFDWSLLANRPVASDCFLAGGLTPENVADAIAVVHPWGVDVASGVEAQPGRKDPEKLRRFVSAAREAGDRGQGTGYSGARPR